MVNNEVLIKIKNMLSKSFELKENIKIADEAIDLYGIWTEEFGRTIFGKNKVIDKYECNEHLLIKEITTLSSENINNFEELLKLSTIKLVKPHVEHKTSYITGIILYNSNKPIDEIVKRKVEKLKYTKNYRFSLYGWSVVRIVVIDIERNEIINNKAAKEIALKLTDMLKQIK